MMVKFGLHNITIPMKWRGFDHGTTVSSVMINYTLRHNIWQSILQNLIAILPTVIWFYMFRLYYLAHRALDGRLWSLILPHLI